jgi:hypothetical protein
VSAGVPAQPPNVTAEREYMYDAEGELSDALDRRRGWVQYEYDPPGGAGRAQALRAEHGPGVGIPPV